MSKPIIEISGYKELQAKIKKLANDKDKKKEVLLILRQVAKPTLQLARQNAPVSKKAHLVSGKRTKKTISPGALKKSLGLITGKSNNPTVYVGPRAKGSFDGWYGHFVHEGHDIYKNATSYTVYKKKKVKRSRNSLQRIRGKGINNVMSRTKGNPFIKNAYEQTKGNVTADAENRVAKFIQRRIDKLS